MRTYGCLSPCLPSFPFSSRFCGVGVAYFLLQRSILSLSLSLSSSLPLFLSCYCPAQRVGKYVRQHGLCIQQRVADQVHPSSPYGTHTFCPADKTPRTHAPKSPCAGLPRVLDESGDVWPQELGNGALPERNVLDACGLNEGKALGPLVIGEGAP